MENYLLKLLQDFCKDYNDVEAKINNLKQKQKQNNNYNFDLEIFNLELMRDSFSATILEITKQINKDYGFNK